MKHLEHLKRLVHSRQFFGTNLGTFKGKFSPHFLLVNLSLDTLYDLQPEKINPLWWKH